MGGGQVPCVNNTEDFFKNLQYRYLIPKNFKVHHFLKIFSSSVFYITVKTVFITLGVY